MSHNFLHRLLGRSTPERPVSSLPTDDELTDLLSLAAAEVSAFSLSSALPLLQELAATRAQVVSAKVDEHFGSVEVLFPQHSFSFAVQDPYQAKCLAAACRLSEPRLLGVIVEEHIPGALLLISASPWSIYLEVESARDLSSV